MLKVAVLGLGGRGRNYGTHLANTKGVEIVSVCDQYQAKIDNVKKKWGVPDEGCFTDDKKFFAQGKVADVMVIATQDRDHYGHAMQALDLGYNLLLEKPVSPDIAECLAIEKKAREKGLKVLVCHVLRYSNYYRRIHDIIASGVLGEIMLIKHDEHIAYWHFAHSYVRGNWRREDETSPGSKCKKVSCMGGLYHFKKENAPEGSADNCFDCKYNKTCIYDCRYQYTGRNRGPFIGKHKFKWGTYAFCTSGKKKDVLNALKNDPRGKLWSRCVYKCDNDVADLQTLQMEMCNGTQVVMTVNAFNEDDHRHTEIRGTKGELYADDTGSVIRLRLFDKHTKKITVNVIPVIKGHYGGDEGIIKATVGLLKGLDETKQQYTWIKDTVESHRIAAAAERSRREGGRVVEMSEIPDTNATCSKWT